ncbi:MAG TPA: hypothetical protein VKU00_02085 [Chthonomonadaceae bacterium]|nr:hypothetical protein [Chthonomonadaceae bacterium]
MSTTLRLNTTVLPGHRIEVTAPELPEGACVELIVTDPAVEPLRRYPSVLEAEYDTLIDKELHGTLTETEALRLEAICQVIAEIDRLTLSSDPRTERLQQLETELDQIRTEIDALPDA